MNSILFHDHLPPEMIFAFLDGELAEAARLEAENHLAGCEVCQKKLEALQKLSLAVETAVRSTPIPAMDGVRQRLEKGTVLQSIETAAAQHPNRIMRRFGWGMGIAATVAFAISVVPHHYLNPTATAALSEVAPPAAAPAGSIEVDGEAFFPVPYSNADLSTAAPHIVQMQVPVSSLADIGIVFEPVTNRMGGSGDTDRSVLADVLVGADGQPRGVHVIGIE